MEDITASYHFVPSDDLPLIEERTSFREAFEILERGQRGAFIVARNGNPRAFIRGRAFADDVLARAHHSLRAYERFTTTPIGDLLQSRVRADVLVPLGATVGPRHEQAALRALNATAFSVEQAGRRLGWFLNHETVRETTTARPWFRCSNPTDPHDNPTPDHGWCQMCPYALLGLNNDT